MTGQRPFLATYREVQQLLAKPERPHDEHGRPVLFPGSGVCADCGEPYGQPGLISRCQDRHV